MVLSLLMQQDYGNIGMHHAVVEHIIHRELLLSIQVTQNTGGQYK